jgi:DNA mismatch endonuclease, patch repair protein
MVDTLTREERGTRMALVRNKDTKPEMRVRSMAHRMGFRFRLHGPGIPGHPDLVFTSARKVLFVHGCFWHRHPGCPRTRLPKSRLDFWKPKLLGNARRDRKNQAALQKLGWSFLVIWECETENENTLRRMLLGFLSLGSGKKFP